MPSASLRHLTRLYGPLRPAARAAAALPLFRHAGPTLHSRPTSSTGKFFNMLGRDVLEQVRFKESDVPPRSFWEERAAPPYIGGDEVTPEECFDACRRYAALAVEGTPGWRRRALVVSHPTRARARDSSGKISMYTLHYVAVLMIQRVSNDANHMLMHILQTGVVLRYAPSILTLANLALRRNLLDRQHFEPTKEALEELAYPSSSSSAAKSAPAARSISTRPPKPDPYRADALTLLGMEQARLNTDDGDRRALRHLEDAEAAAAAFAATQPSAPSDYSFWSWHATCLLEQARIHERRGRASRAREVLRAAATAGSLDNAAVCYRYAMLLPADDPARAPLLRRAAVSGVDDAAREMSRVELAPLEREERARKRKDWLRRFGGREQDEEGRREVGDGRGKEGDVAPLTDRQKREMLVLADEWLAIAGDKALV
ncbi:hypothetical protein GGR52DRAFT_583526 [Hypoxylon sp. FL1284]|nr:hypothetical protein GGR52DRAFT_583526 [Hypoxylon sp. FL1284]